MPPNFRPCYPIDFSLFMRSGRSAGPTDVAIIVTPAKRATRLGAKYVGWVAIRRPGAKSAVLVHADLDDLGVAPFFSEAFARVQDRWPRARIHTLMNLGVRGTGIACPPPPPLEETWARLVGGVDELITLFVGQPRARPRPSSRPKRRRTITRRR
jgi:hypothetical protein